MMDPWPYSERQGKKWWYLSLLWRTWRSADKVQEAKLRWFGHVQLRQENYCDKQILEANVHGQWSRGRQRKRWIYLVKYNMKDLLLNVEDVENKAKWRRRTWLWLTRHLRDNSLK